MVRSQAGICHPKKLRQALRKLPGSGLIGKRTTQTFRLVFAFACQQNDPKRLHGESAMDPVLIETYKGYDIRVYAWKDAGTADYVGMYEISPSARHEFVKGGFVIAREAEKAALEQATRWIDQRS